jgi:hypothetical protein
MISETDIDDFSMRLPSRTFGGVTIICVFEDLCTGLHCINVGTTPVSKSRPSVLIWLGLAGMIRLCFF